MEARKPSLNVTVCTAEPRGRSYILVHLLAADDIRIRRPTPSINACHPDSCHSFQRHADMRHTSPICRPHLAVFRNIRPLFVRCPYPLLAGFSLFYYLTRSLVRPSPARPTLLGFLSLLYASAYLILPTELWTQTHINTPRLASPKRGNRGPLFSVSPSSFPCFSILAQPTRRRQPEPTRRRRQIRAFPSLLPPAHLRRSYRPSLYCRAPISQYSNLAPYLTRLRMYLNNGSCSCGVQSHASISPNPTLRALSLRDLLL